MGRHSTFSEEVADDILDGMADGKSLREMCKKDGYPAPSTIFRWIADHPEFGERYARAREMQTEALVDDLLSIADDGTNDWMENNDPDNPGYRINGEHIQRSKIRLDARKWIAARILPKKYGDRVTNEHTSPDGSMTPKASIDASKLSTETMREILGAMDAKPDADAG